MKSHVENRDVVPFEHNGRHQEMKLRGIFGSCGGRGWYIEGGGSETRMSSPQIYLV